MSYDSIVIEENVATESLRVVFPKGSTVTVTVTSFRPTTRGGSSETTLLVLASFDGKVSNVSGWVASATGLPRISILTIDGDSSRVLVRNVGNPHAAAGVLITRLAVDLYGDENALELHIV